MTATLDLMFRWSCSIRLFKYSTWDAIEAQLQAVSHDALSRRRVRALRWLYVTGLRISDREFSSPETISRAE